MNTRDAARTQSPVPGDGGGARGRAATRGRLAVRAEVGRISLARGKPCFSREPPSSQLARALSCVGCAAARRRSAQAAPNQRTTALTQPGKNVPFPPMEAELVDELPRGDAWQYEPKWDGFRGVLENDGGELALWSRNGRPLLRYFPELRPLGDLLPPHSALDGEIVIARDGRLDFDAMQLRLHPAESRIRKLSAEIPAEFVAFDLLLWKGKPVHKRPLEERRAELEDRAAGFRLSPTTDDTDAAQEWLRTLRAAGFDGVVAKRLGLPYLPGSREAVLKVKPYKTADCVIVGLRWKEKPTRIATLLLGLYDDDGEMDYVGSAAVAASRHAQIAERVFPLLEGAPERGFS